MKYPKMLNGCVKQFPTQIKTVFNMNHNKNLSTTSSKISY